MSALIKDNSSPPGPRAVHSPPADAALSSGPLPLEPEAGSADPGAPAPSIAPPAWQLAALVRPAVLPGAGLSPTVRLWLDWILQASAQGLERTLDRPVSFDIPSSPPEPGAHEPDAFGIAFNHPACPGGGLLVLDLPLARILLDSVESDFASLRGAGHLSSAEAGLLEYVTLACVDHVLRQLAPARPEFTLAAFLTAQEVEQRLRSETGATPSASLVVRIAGREGMARLHLPGPFSAAEPDLHALIDSTISRIDPNAMVEIRLALPPFALSIPADDTAGLAPGDVLLPGLTRLEGLAGCRLVTSTGWRLATASILRDSPTTLSAVCGEFNLAAPPVSPGDGPARQATVLIGSATLPLEQLQNWRAGVQLDLAKDVQLPAELHIDNALAARGELVLLDGEIGIRIVEIG